jgi:hypothetical protein
MIEHMYKLNAIIFLGFYYLIWANEFWGRFYDLIWAEY